MIIFKVYTVTEHIVEIDPGKINIDPRCKESKHVAAPPSMDETMRKAARLAVFRGDYLRKNEIKTRTCREGEPPETITINEDL